MFRFARFLAAAGVAALSLSCADKSTGLRTSGLAWLPITPVFSMAPEGGPRIGIAAVEAVLKRPGAADSNFANSDVRGDSAILEFPRVIVMGDSSTFALEVRAFDANDELVFKAMEDIRIKPGDNAPMVPVLQYVAPDANVESIDVLRLSPDVTLPAQLVTEFNLDWAGGAAGSTSCLSRLPTAGAITQTQLTASGITATGPVANVRVGWTSRDTTVATVDASGMVRARCSNKSTYIVARTFLDVADSVRVDVTAVPFTLMMTPETANVHREDSLQLAAVVVDENGNAMTTTGVSWNTSDSSLATVSATGMVYGVRNGRVLITASSGNRTAVGVVQVVAPRASSVVVQPPIDTLVVGQSRLYSAAAFDAGGNRIPDAAGFSWGSDNSGIARVSASGVVTGVGPGDARIVVKLDGKKDTSLVHVRVATSGLATGSVIDAATGAALSGVSVNDQGTGITTDGNGQFTTMPQTPPTDLQFSATGYVSVMYYQVPVSLGQTVDLGDIPMVPINANPSTLTGTVV
ncbi:MAG TPA: Ig-like domain-containing protein, partial [Gemmatimonadaceae bacterium]|nr:Ig-like domain-containing protein [Gemmatimonadaceae bacterium]